MLRGGQGEILIEKATKKGEQEIKLEKESLPQPYPLLNFQMLAASHRKILEIKLFVHVCVLFYHSRTLVDLVGEYQKSLSGEVSQHVLNISYMKRLLESGLRDSRTSQDLGN